MLTEDIDASIRAMLSGYRLIHDRSIVSTELATENGRSWWRQRLRWAQGWLQVTVRHQDAVWRSDVLDPQTKLYWTYLLGWREVFAPLSLQIVALLAAARIVRIKIRWFSSPYLVGTTVLTLVAGPALSAVAYRVALWRTKRSLRGWFVVFSLSSLAYTTLKNTVAMVAMLRQALHKREWLVTPRPDARGWHPPRLG
jgi:cellulose synthase/poly-beta-1,6-N-acetylglucosamine synthase-like glycosyltransferase